jgi:hypothetical protein
MMVWLATAILIALLVGAIGATAWVLAKARKAGTGVLLAATAGFAVLWLVGLVNFFALATQ